jgi:hypothetical protein
MVVLLLCSILIGRRMQGNAGDDLETSSMMRRAIYDRDLAAHRSGETADDPLMP